MQILVRAHCASCLATTQKTTSWWLTSPREVFAGLLSPLSPLVSPRHGAAAGTTEGGAAAHS